VKRLLVILVWLALIAVGLLAEAAEPERELDREAARELIALALEVRESPIAIASITAGGLREDDFEAREVRRVTAVLPVLEEGRLVRRVRCYDFRWDPRLGWFHQETRRVRGGEELWIWSERVGREVIR